MAESQPIPSSHKGLAAGSYPYLFKVKSLKQYPDQQGCLHYHKNRKIDGSLCSVSNTALHALVTL